MPSVRIGTVFGTYLKLSKRYAVTGLLTLACYGGGMALAHVILNLYYREIFDLLASSSPGDILRTELLRMVVTIALIVCTYNVLWRVADFLMVYTQTNILRDLANYSLEHLQRHSYNFFTGNFTGSLVAKSKRFVRSFETIHDRFTFSFWQTGIQLLGVFVVMALTIPKLAVFFAIWVAGFLLITYFLIRIRMRFDLAAAATDSNVTGALADVITNILNVKMFSSSKEEMRTFKKVTHADYRAHAKAWYVGNAFYAIQGVEMIILEVVGMYMTLALWAEGSVTIGTVVLIQSYFASVMMNTWDIGRAMSDIFRSLSDASEMVEIFETPLEVKDRPDPEVPRIAKGHIRLDDVRFHYVQDHDVFSRLALDILPGQKVGIVGHSGAGKSTLFKLLLRFLDVTGGAITIDGQDIRAITQDDLRRHISYVPQDPILFHRSLLENIAYAKPGASNEEVTDAAKRAHAHEFISTLPAGYETLVGERGVKLSGGERQRVAIARVILKNAPILLLDEATSSLDSVSEKYIQEQLKEIMKNRTTLAIAHRISTIKQMDRIIVFEGGAVIEDGSHDELLVRGGTYAELWSHQSQGFLID